MKPNVLLITADQWRGDSLSAVGHPLVKTPHVDALAAEGVLFERHYASAAPCSPARAGLYTGLYQMNHRVCRNGSPLDHRFDNVALAARRAGYDATLFGYTDTAPDPRRLDPNDPHLTTYEGVLPGFTVRQLLTEDEKQWLSWLRARGHAGATSRDVHLPVEARPGEVTRNPPAYAAEETQSAFLAGEFLRWVEEQDRPWFAHVSFIRPHPPFVVPEPFNRLYPPQPEEGFHRAASRDAEMALHPYLAFDLPNQRKASFLHGAPGRVSEWSAAEIAEIRAIYHGMITETDHQLGRIFDQLKALGAWDNTIVVFTSDHAEMAGDHWSFGKGGFFDGSYHIPLVIRDPRRKASAGGRVRHFTSAADIFPTLSQIWAVEPANALDGASLVPFLDGATPRHWRDAAFFEFDFRDVETGLAESHFGLAPQECNLAVLRDERYKYVHFNRLPPLLFDLAEDPSERINRAEDPAYLPIRLAFAEKLLSLRATHLDQTLALTTLTDRGAISAGPRT
ncbi:alkaline phosphatase family protein [Gellertiella hungarica]|uniref:Arylsulfatase A-like enzyme n=1 Tax=Gellertiella hungarica TaxID=1572859 RepID=A0A7W6J1B6_9HYPH|nr:alkaline phosphatase family protein [Gellertiella hungarica]MBB4062969.1 arylsulfatase A-like enzyme [Gellertiella hungarica]